MRTIAITPASESVIPFLKELLSNPAWVSKITISNEIDDFSKYNTETRLAINDVENDRNMTVCQDFDDYKKKINDNEQVL
ncbi:MAG: hypothetical protein LBT83_01700 [Tannerella sp.]|nr:hypothetical protein [Tannerella sp.]